MDMDKAVSVWIRIRLCQYGYGYKAVSVWIWIRLCQYGYG